MRALFLSLLLLVAPWRIQMAVEAGLAASLRPRPSRQQQQPVPPCNGVKPCKTPLAK